MKIGFSKICVSAAIVLLLCCQSGCVSTFDITSDIQKWSCPESKNPPFKDVCEAIKQTKQGSFMVTCGDMRPPKRVYDIVETTLGPDYTWYPVIGNHCMHFKDGMQWLRDYTKEHLFETVSPGPEGSEETTYSFDFKKAHIIVLNQFYDGQSDTGTGSYGDVCDALYEWVKKDLQTNTKPIVFIFGHKPFVAIADIDHGIVRHRNDELVSIQSENSHRMLKLFREHHVTAYIHGHTHTYSHAKINGTWHISAGHSMGCSNDTDSTFLKVKMGLFGCRIEAYRLDKEHNMYNRRHVVDLN